ncbi:MAG: isocitrate/isopropylmalate family dehydrogenase [Gammaproteobacteria bacterium]|nr:isocitrate/isopropylmalate family dehydrogenase [Gammaproteobacteria bacterium]
MHAPQNYRIAVMPGDGIGPEVTTPCLELLQAAAEIAGGFSLTYETLAAGAVCYQQTGDAFPAESLQQAASADAVLLGAMGLPDVRYPDGTEIAPQLDLRFELGLYAGVRPVRVLPGLPPVLANPRAAAIDFVLIRESTEGLFASRGKGEIDGDQAARDTLVITRAVSEQLFDFAFRLARRRKQGGHPGCVTCVDKANVFKSFAFFRSVFRERAKVFSDIDAQTAYVDAIALNMLRHPWAFDVLVTENMFGDILSDLGAGLMGGMGMAPSADIGAEHAVFQPCHGSAPDIAGQGLANPTAMFLSAAMLLEWLGDTHANAHCSKAAGLISAAVDEAYADGTLLPAELGGEAGTRAVHERVMASLSASREQV